VPISRLDDAREAVIINALRAMAARTL